MFSIAIVIYVIGAISFLLFGECEIQEWAKRENIRAESASKPELEEGEKFIQSKQ